MKINDYTDFKNVTIAEYKTAIFNAKQQFIECIKKKDKIGALEAMKLRVQLEKYLNKKYIDGQKNNYQGHKRT